MVSQLYVIYVSVNKVNQWHESVEDGCRRSFWSGPAAFGDPPQDFMPFAFGQVGPFAPSSSHKNIRNVQVSRKIVQFVVYSLKHKGEWIESQEAFFYMTS